LLIAVARDRRAGLGAAAVATVGVVALVAFRIDMFGEPVPLSVAAKGAAPDVGALYVARGLLFIVGPVGGWLAWLGVRKRPALGAVAIAHLGSIALIGGDWMPGFRLLAPVVPVIVSLAVSGLRQLVESPPRGRRWLPPAAAALTVAAPVVALLVELPAARASGELRREVGATLARELRALGGPVALVDIGYLGYESGLEVVDLGGLTDATIARRPGGHLAKEIDVGYLEARRPATFVLHSSTPPTVTQRGELVTLGGFPVERRIAASAWFQRMYRVVSTTRYAPDYHYVIARRITPSREPSAGPRSASE
jgi:hypothetical protein